MLLSAAAIMLGMAVKCAPHSSPDVPLSVAYAESGWNPLAIHDNPTDQAILPATLDEAVRIASRLIAAGRNPDLGFMQINAMNLERAHLTVRTAFDACASLRAGDQILLDGYRGGATTKEQQTAILAALSSYNTGSSTAGLQTYVPRVLAAARKVIPALRLAGMQPFEAPPDDAAKAMDTRKPKPNSSGWDVAAEARKERAGRRKASSLLTFTPPATGN